MLTAADFGAAATVLLFAVYLGLVNRENKIYILMIAWLVLTYTLASIRAVEFVFLIIMWSVIFNIVLHLMVRACCNARSVFRTTPARRPRMHMPPAA